MCYQLSAVLECIYFEFLESGPFKYIIRSSIYPQNLNLNSITDRLNNAKPSIKFTCELESNKNLTFFGCLIYKE